MNTNEITGINISDGNNSFYGPDQHWYKRKLAAMSGCGPTTASIAFAHLARNNDSSASLYPYTIPFEKHEFLDFMEDVRLNIKPNFGPMTDASDFCKKCKAYAQTKGAGINYNIIDKSLDMQDVFEKVVELIDNNILPSLLILRNPHREINEFTWHWMSITGYIKDTKEIMIATYGKRHKMDFTKAWNQKKPFSTDVIWFYSR